MLPTPVLAATDINLTAHPVGWACVALFILAYTAVVLEERIHIAKSKPVMLGAGLIWALIAWKTGGSDETRAAFEHMLLEYAGIFFFLVSAMTYVSAMDERGVFEAMRVKLVQHGFSYRNLFWITGLMAFFLSPIIDNLTTSLVMSAVVLAVGVNSPRFVTLSMINLVVAANAGGAWSAFGDITTLMVWQADKAEFFDFFRLFLPSLINWLIPAVCMFFALPHGKPEATEDHGSIKHGGIAVCVFFALTIAITVTGKQLLGMPASYGMLTGLALLTFLASFIERKESRQMAIAGRTQEHAPYSIFRVVATVEWDTLLFFYGVFACVGGLATLGYLTLVSHTLYGTLGFAWSNSILGALSAIVDNIPIMYAVVQMDPSGMQLPEWLLITLTAGVGGSLLSIGSAAGVALMGVSRGKYTFGSHLRWTWAIALGYVASILFHLWFESLITGG